MLELSDDAYAILTGHFGFNPKSTLTLNNQESRLTERSAAAMTELVAAGYVKDGKADNGYAESRTYSLTERGKALTPMPIMWMEKHGKFSLVEPIHPTTHT